MKFEQKMKIAEDLFEQDEASRRLQDPRFFPPPPDPRMVEKWEPIARWKYANPSNLYE